MRRKVLLAVLVASAATGPAAFAQQAPQVGGIRSETQRRLSAGDQTNDALNWLGIIGLLGLAGLHRGHHDEDSYHPSPID